MSNVKISLACSCAAMAFFAPGAHDAISEIASSSTDSSLITSLCGCDNCTCGPSCDCLGENLDGRNDAVSGESVLQDIVSVNSAPDFRLNPAIADIPLTVLAKNSPDAHSPAELLSIPYIIST
jgi:hypothetical protein